MFWQVLRVDGPEIAAAGIVLVALAQVLPGAVVGAIIGLGISLSLASRANQRADAGGTVLWMIGCGIAGAVLTPTVVAIVSS